MYILLYSIKRNCFTESDEIKKNVFWNGNYKLPVYSHQRDRMSTEAAAGIILDEEFDESLLCQMQPTCVDKNASFVVDLGKLQDPKDINCDDMGSWRANGTHPSYVLVNNKGTISTLSQQKMKRGKVPGRQYKVVKRYYFHKTATDLNKTIFLVLGMPHTLLVDVHVFAYCTLYTICLYAVYIYSCICITIH